MISDGTFEELECAVSDDRHFVNEPIILPACGHSLCRCCIPKTDAKIIKCKICNTITERDISNDKECLAAKKSIQRNLESLLKIIEKQAAKSIERVKGINLLS